MAKKNKRSEHNTNILLTDETETSEMPNRSTDNQFRETKQKRFWAEWGTAQRLGAIAVGLFLAMGAFGSGMKYLEDSAQQQKANLSASSDKKNDGSYLSALNPFVAASTPTPPPQLSKEYIYAGSRMLAVEDANADVAPPVDLAVWRPSTGYWYVMGSQGSQQTFFQWGGDGDKTVPGDYDGDGKTDFSIWRPSNGTWFIVRSSDSTSYSLQFGASGDKVAPADYDGDGRTDPALFRPTTGTWYIQRSSLGFTTHPYGQDGDEPAPADYDGDGKADLGLWRGDGYTFYFLQSSGGPGQLHTFVGSNPSDKPVSGDYDGDGKADLALKSGTSWLIRYSTTNQTEAITPTWEAAGDEPVQNDYDGDGKVDIAVWRPLTGYWYIRQSASGNSLRQVQWGQAGDKPVPAFYRR